MKIKPLYIYLASFLVFGIAVIIFSSNAEKSKSASQDFTHGQMPDDNIHGGMNSENAPSKANVSEEAKQKMVELKAMVEKNPKDTARVRQFADMLVFHQPDEAEKYYKRILSMDAKRNDVLLQLTLISFNKHDFNKAEEYSNAILKNDPNYATAYYNLGAIANAKGNSRKARSIWQNVVKKYPNSDAAKVASNALQQLDMSN